MNRPPNCISVGPPALQPKMNCRARYSGDSGPFGDAHAFPVASKDARFSGVVGLLYQRSPPAIPRLVIPIIVGETVKRHPLWGHPHVGKEVIESEPPAAYRYSAPTVSPVALVGGVCASSYHSSPADMLLCPRKAVPSFYLKIKASARLRAATCEVGALNLLSCSTITATQPKAPPTAWVCQTKYGKPRKRVASQINCVGHFRHLENFTGEWCAATSGETDVRARYPSRAGKEYHKSEPDSKPATPTPTR